MEEEPVIHADGPEQRVSVSRYLRFVVVFLILIFGALGLYEYYYGDRARQAQELQQTLEENAQSGDYATTTIAEIDGSAAL